MKTSSLIGTGVVNCTSIGEPFYVGGTGLTLILQKGDLEPEERSIGLVELLLGWADFLSQYPDYPDPTACGIEDADVYGNCSAMVLSCGGDYYLAKKGDGVNGGWLYPVVLDGDEWVPANDDKCADHPIKAGKIFMKCNTKGTIPEAR